jgi:RimJ/RimL family protein N-acetyltransferase
MEPADAEDLWRWNHDPDVMRWMNDGHGSTLAQTRQLLEGRERNSFRDVLFGVEVIADSVLIGIVRLRDAEPELGCAELDLYLGEKSYWGQGYATETMRAMCRYGFDKMRLHRIFLSVVTENHAACNVYKKVGFVEEGRVREAFRRDGTWYDMFIMGLLDGELR